MNKQKCGTMGFYWAIQEGLKYSNMLQLRSLEPDAGLDLTTLRALSQHQESDAYPGTPVRIIIRYLKQVNFMALIRTSIKLNKTVF